MKLNMKLKLLLTSILCLLFFSLTQAQKKPNPIQITRVEPEFWWVGMKNSNLQILVYGDKIAECEVTIVGKKLPKNKYDVANGIVVNNIEKVENPNYLFINLSLKDAVAGSYHLQFKKGKDIIYHEYVLKSRKKSGEEHKGFSQADAVYLVMPDRFANGDPKNDNVKGLFQSANRKEPSQRHGGDLLGIEKNLDYIKDLGFTALWINPFTENNQPEYSYHGYAITDYYKTDARYGTNQDFMNLVNKAHSKSLKIIVDMVFGHCGNQHWFIKDLPEKTWIHQFPEFTRSNYRLSVPYDVNASNFDKVKMTQGWFDTHMPDLDHRNPRLAVYAIQNAIWWVENFDIDGIRTDTHPYPHKEFMARMCKEVLEEYPNFNIVGEVWDRRVSISAYWQKNVLNRDNYNSYLPGITDFPVHFNSIEAINEDDNDWDFGMAKLYYTLTQDGLYSDASQNMLFLDNHDVSRMANIFGKDIKKQKMALNIISTLRGYPQFYYGAEVLLDISIEDHGKQRCDFPGGWEGDNINAFTGKGLSAEQIDFQNYVKKLFNWRKNATTIHKGKFMHFVPENSVYVYFRYTPEQTVMIINNNHKSEERKLDTKRFAERMEGFTKGYNPITGETITDLKSITIPAKTCLILELK